MEFYSESLTEYKRLRTREVKIGDLLLGNFHPIRVQTMTTTDTMDTIATVSKLSVVLKPAPNWCVLLHLKKRSRKFTEYKK